MTRNTRSDPQILRDFLNYHETIKGQSEKTILWSRSMWTS